MSFYFKFTGINDLPEEVRSTMKKYGILRTLGSGIFSLTGTIFVLHIIDALGFAAAAQIMALMALVQLVLDYPSGTLGDWIGQRWVLGIAYFSYAVANFIFASASTFGMFALAAVVFGFANSQQSGALQSWLDNNYVITDDGDPERKNYGYTMTRFGAVDTLSMGSAIFIGGFLATAFSRKMVFQWQSLIIVMLGILVVLWLKDIHEKKKDESGDGYFTILRKGISAVGSTRKLLFFVIAQSIFMVVWSTWGSLILFPLYFGYSGSDALAGTLRGTIFFIGVGIQILLSGFTRKLKFKHLPLILGLHFTILFVGVSALITIRPLSNTFDPVGFFALILTMTIAVSILQPLLGALFQRITLDIVPSEYRNSIYSLFPTIGGIMSVIILPLTGVMIETYGIVSALMLILGISYIGLLALSISVFYMKSPKLNLKLKRDMPAISGD